MRDWNKEAEQLGSSNFWKPQTGQYKWVEAYQKRLERTVNFNNPHLLLRER